MRFPPLLLLLCLRAAAGTLLVAPDGDDSQVRSSEESQHRFGPFKTLPRAIGALKTLRAKPAFDEDMTIRLAPGRYELERPIEFTAAEWDSPGGHRLTIQGARGCILSGGVVVSGWKQDAARSQIWTASVPAGESPTWEPHQLFWDKRRLHRARTPNGGYFYATAQLGTNSPMTVPCNLADVAGLSRDFGGWFVSLNRWSDMRFAFKAVSESQKAIIIDCPPRFFLMDEAHPRYWIENVPEALDEPGEWLWDARQRTLSLFVPSGVDPNRAELIASRLPVLIEFRGSNERPVQNVEFENIVFSDADCEIPASGYGLTQAAANIRGAIRADYSSDIKIRNCEIRNCGGYAIDLERGCHRWEVSGNHLHDLGAGGIRIGEEAGVDDPVHGTYGTQFTDNHVHALGRIFPPACGVIIFQSATNTIAHNEIHDLFYTAISVGWTWGYIPSPCRANRIEFNHLHDVGQGMLSDLGGVYTLGPQPGTAVRNNVIHDVRSYLYGAWGLYTDEGSTGIVMENNVVYRCQSAGFHQHFGENNLIQNNLFVENRAQMLEMTRIENHRSFWFYNNVLVSSSGNLLSSAWHSGTYDSDGNVWYDTRWKTDFSKYKFAGDAWDQWRARGRDQNSMIADPLLVDLEHPAKGLRKNSPAYGLGFRPIDARNVGPRKGLF